MPFEKIQNEKRDVALPTMAETLGYDKSMPLS